MATLRTIRIARPQDAGPLAAIDAAVSVNPWSKKQFAAACSDSDSNRETTLVLEFGGQVGGFVVFSQVLDEASVHNIAVLTSCQSRGAGQCLLDAALTQMKKSGAARCLLEVRESNLVARRLYAGNGFILDGVRKHYYSGPGRREDALLLSREV